MVSYFSYSWSSSTQKEINLLFLSLSSSLTLNVLTYQPYLSNGKTNGLISLSKYPSKYLELVSISFNFDMVILPT